MLAEAIISLWKSLFTPSTLVSIVIELSPNLLECTKEICDELGDEEVDEYDEQTDEEFDVSLVG